MLDSRPHRTGEDRPPLPRSVLSVVGAVVARRRFVIAGLLVLVHVGLLVGLANRVARTTDEQNYIGIGRAIVTEWEWATPAERLHGPLPFLATQTYVGELTPETWGRNLVAGRLGMLPFAVLLLLVLGVWAWEAWGWRGGLLVLFLSAFEPNLLGNGSLATADVALTATSTLTFWLLWRWMRRPSVVRLVAWGAALGLCLATKYLALLLAAFAPLPVLIVLLCGADLTPSPWAKEDAGLARRLAWGAGQVVVAAAVALFVLHAAYLFCAPLYDPAVHGAVVSGVLRGLPGVEYLLRVLPAPMVQGADYQAAISRDLVSSFFDYVTPHWAYYLTSFGTKVPLAVLGLFLLAFLPRIAGAGRAPWLGLCCGIPGVLLLVYLSFFNHLQNGIRYALPILPLLLLWAGRFTCTRWWRSATARVGTAALCLWLLVANAVVWPHQFGYFNETIGGRGGAYRIFSDTNCDWWQDRDEGRAALTARYPEVEFLDEASGPRFGLLAIYVADFHRIDREREGRTYHWLRRFAAIDHYAAAWFVFRITPADFEAAMADGDARAARDLALAWTWEGDPTRARAALASLGEGPRKQELEEMIDVLERVERGEATKAEAMRTYLALRVARHADLALRLASSPVSKFTFDELMIALYRGGKGAEAMRLLREKATTGPLTPGQAMMLAALLYEEDPGSLEALRVLDEHPAPAPGERVARIYGRVRALIERAAAERRRLLDAIK